MVMKKVTGWLRQLAKLDTSDYGTDFLQTWDKSEDEIRATLLVVQTLKELYERNVCLKVFESGLAVSEFRDQSTRTRFSFSSAASLLGLTPIEFDVGKSQVQHGETVRETVNMISFMTEVQDLRTLTAKELI